MNWKLLFERLVRSRRWLKLNHCAKGVHWHRWWWWRDGVSYSNSTGLPKVSGWESVCEVCLDNVELDVGTPPPEVGIDFDGSLIPPRLWRKYTG